jgi:hypothetical protein
VTNGEATPFVKAIFAIIMATNMVMVGAAADAVCGATLTPSAIAIRCRSPSPGIRQTRRTPFSESPTWL